MSALAGGVFAADGTDENAQVRAPIGDIGRRSLDARLGGLPPPGHFDEVLWRNLSASGLDRLTSTPGLGAGPSELAVVLRSLGRYAGAVPLAETDLLAAWLGDRVGLELPSGPLTVAIADAPVIDGRLSGTANDVPWLGAADGALLAVRCDDGLRVMVLEPGGVTGGEGQNLAGEPRSSVPFDLPADRFVVVEAAVGDELIRRGAWARCVQIVGALDAAAESSVAHAGERVQFGRALSRFQAVQHALAQMAGEIERARAATTLAVAAAADHGFDASETDYAVTVARVVMGPVVDVVVTLAHQLHGAIGVTREHRLWLATMRARSWVDEFGSTGWYARRLGRAVLGSGDPWDLMIGTGLNGW